MAAAACIGAALAAQPAVASNTGRKPHVTGQYTFDNANTVARQSLHIKQGGIYAAGF